MQIVRVCTPRSALQSRESRRVAALLSLSGQSSSLRPPSESGLLLMRVNRARPVCRPAPLCDGVLPVCRPVLVSCRTVPPSRRPVPPLLSGIAMHPASCARTLPCPNIVGLQATTAAKCNEVRMNSDAPLCHITATVPVSARAGRCLLTLLLSRHDCYMSVKPLMKGGAQMGEKRRDEATVGFSETMRLIRMGVTADTQPAEE